MSAVARGLVWGTPGLACPSHWRQVHWGGREGHEGAQKWEEEGEELMLGKRESAKVNQTTNHNVSFTLDYILNQTHQDIRSLNVQ